MPKPLILLLIVGALIAAIAVVRAAGRSGGRNHYRAPEKPSARVEMTRHVALHRSGLGATFQLKRQSTGRHDWTWKYDAGLPNDIHTTIATRTAITNLEEELGLPPTYRKPVSRPVRTEVNDDEQIDLQARGVDSVDELVVGRLYIHAGDPAIYRGVFQGNKFAGWGIDEDGPLGTWLEFESPKTEVGQSDVADIRISIDHLGPQRSSNSGAVTYRVTQAPSSALLG